MDYLCLMSSVNIKPVRFIHVICGRSLFIFIAVFHCMDVPMCMYPFFSKLIFYINIIGDPQELW